MSGKQRQFWEAVGFIDNFPCCNYGIITTQHPISQAAMTHGNCKAKYTDSELKIVNVFQDAHWHNWKHKGIHRFIWNFTAKILNAVGFFWMIWLWWFLIHKDRWMSNFILIWIWRVLLSLFLSWSINSWFKCNRGPSMTSIGSSHLKVCPRLLMDQNGFQKAFGKFPQRLRDKSAGGLVPHWQQEITINQTLMELLLSSLSVSSSYRLFNWLRVSGR